MAKGSYVFVAVVFGLLGLAFIASTALVVLEFRQDWLAMLIAHSHLFIFFPTLGLLALCAFYLPSVVFTDLYWHYVTLGRVRFVIGTLVAIGLAIGLSEMLHGSSLRGIWELSPDALARDEAKGPGEGPRRPARTVLLDTIQEAGHRLSISQFARNCAWDTKIERPPADSAKRYCLPSGSMMTSDECCRSQRAFRDHVRTEWGASGNRSKASEYDRYLLPFKVFFILILVVIGCFLVFWRKQLKARYGDHLPLIERGVMIGALAMLVWPLMDYGYQQTSDVMFGREYSGFSLRMSLVIAPWAALLLLYFVDFGKDSDRIAQISTVVGGGVAVLRYQEINDLSARVLGSGAAWWHFAIIVAAGLGGLWWLTRPPPPPRTPGVRSRKGQQHEPTPEQKAGT